MPDQYGNPTEAELRGQTSYPNTLAYTPATPDAIRARRDAARAGEGTVDIYRGDGTSTHVTGSQLRASTDPELMRYRQQMIASGVSDPNMIFGPEGGGRQQSEFEREYRHRYHNLMRNPNKGVDHNEAIRAFGMWAAAVAAAYALPVAAPTAGAEAGAATTAATSAGTTAGTTAATTAGTTAGTTAATTAATSALPEIVVTGTLGSGGLTAGEIAALSSFGSAGLGSAVNSSVGTPNTLGSQTVNTTNNQGWSNTSDPVNAFQNTASSNAESLAQSGGIQGGAGTGTPNWLSNATSLFGGGGASGGSMWDDLIPLFGQLAGSYFESRGADRASDAMAQAAALGIGEQRRQYDQSRTDQMPWLEAGRGALTRLQDPDAFTTSPGYEFVRGEGNRDINNSFAARGGALSGNALRALDQYNTGLASQEYNNWFNQNASIAGIGQSSAQNLAGVGANSANNVSNLLTNQGNARASGIIGQTDAYTNGLNQVGQWYGNMRRRNQAGAY